MSDTLREQLAALEHERWSGWMRYMLSRCIGVGYGGTLTIPSKWAERWQKQIDTPYAELSESEKDGDRREADRTIQLILEYKGES